MIDIAEICGWIGSISYSTYTIPQAIDAFRKKQTLNLSSGMVWMLFFGSLCSLIYILPDFTSPLFYNFSIFFQSVCLLSANRHRLPCCIFEGEHGILHISRAGRPCAL